MVKYSDKQFLKFWGQKSIGKDSVKEDIVGIALILETTPDFFKNKGDSKVEFKFRSTLLSYFIPYKQFLSQFLLAMLTGCLISFILPFLSQLIIDVGIKTKDLHIIWIILIAQLVLTVGQMSNDLIRSWLMLHMTTRISITLVSNFLSKLMRLPISFFDSKNIGDIMQRLGDHSRIQNFLTGSLLSVLMAIVTFCVYSVVMGSYSLKILLIFFVGSIFYVVWVLLFMNRRRILDYIRFQESAADQGNIVQLISGMQDIKLNGCEKQKRWEWERIQARLFNVRVKTLILGQTQQIGGIFIDKIKNILISFLAAKSVIDNEMTIGMMIAVQYIIGQLNAPILQFIQFVQELQDAKISLERLNEIHNRKDEETSNKQYISDVPINADIEFKNVTFQYNGKNSERILDNVTIVIPHNKITAIVGVSGSGKTTMIKMLLGFYEPVSGEILVGNRPLSDYSPSAWRRKCGAVMQDGYIFSDTIFNNIGVSDEYPDSNKVQISAHIANVDEYIKSLPLDYNTIIGEEGNGISSGQRQRILIARAIYKNSKYFFLDEATNSLDAYNESVIMENLNRWFKNKTVVIAAHRLSTIKKADNIIVLEKGKIVESGTHTDLLKKEGFYYSLIKNQMR